MLISELDWLCEVLRFAGFMAYGLGKPLTLWIHGLRVEGLRAGAGVFEDWRSVPI